MMILLPLSAMETMNRVQVASAGLVQAAQSSTGAAALCSYQYSIESLEEARKYLFHLANLEVRSM